MSNFTSLNASVINVNTLNASKFNTGSIVGTMDELIISSDQQFVISSQNIITKLVCTQTGTLTLTIDNGLPGQLKIIILTHGLPVQITLTPITCSGFQDVQFNNIGETLTLLYIDDIIGWIIQSNFGCIINVS
jgi:hypothetical protein